MEYTITGEQHELIGRKPLKPNLTFVVILGFMLAVLFYNNYKKFGNVFQKYDITYILSHSVLILAALYFLIQVLDRRVQLVINNNGVWLRKKGLFSWDRFQYYFKRTVRKKRRTEMRMKLRDNGEVDFDINGYDVAGARIKEAMEYYAGQYGVQLNKEEFV
jgi:hypothetical protein